MSQLLLLLLKLVMLSSSLPSNAVGAAQQLSTTACCLSLTADLTTENGSTILHISASAEEENTRIYTHSGQYPTHWCAELRLALKIFSCPRLGTDFPEVAKISHLLITTAGQEQSSNEQSSNSSVMGTNCTDTLWSISLPSYFHGSCIEVQAIQSNIGYGGAIPELRARFESVAEESSSCLHNGICLDESSHDGAVVTLVRRQQNSEQFIAFIVFGDGSAQALPPCTRIEVTSTATGLWSKVSEDSPCSENESRVSFVPERIHLISGEELFVSGNALLYSPNRGEIFYQLQLPTGAILGVREFVTSRDSSRTFAALFMLDTGREEVWLGYSGTPWVVRLYPSLLLDRLWNHTPWDLLPVTLAFDDQDQLLLAVPEEDQVILPLQLLISHYLISLDEPSNCSENAPTNHSLELLSTGTSPLGPPTCLYKRQCPFFAVHLSAVVCSDVTRYQTHLAEGEQLTGRVDALPEYSCDSEGDTLPRDVFLRKMDAYTVQVTFSLLEFAEDDGSMEYTAWTSDPANLNLSIFEEYLDERTVRYEITVEEKGLLTGQYMSGYILTSAILDLQVPGNMLQCVDPLSTSLAMPGSYRTRLHIGCPPGLSLTFDPVATSSSFDQHCTFTNISCYHFRNAFHPMFAISDEVTGLKQPYVGLFTLHVVGGGIWVDEMGTFSISDNVEYGIWTPVESSEKDGIYQNGSGLRWICGTGSPCGEVRPTKGTVPHYYFRLEASTSGVMENQSYCNFTVRFVIKLHGMPMGAVTTLLMLLMWLFMLTILVVLLFAAWWQRSQFKQWRDSIFGYLYETWMKGRSNDWLIENVRRNMPPSSLRVLPHLQFTLENDSLSTADSNP